jgi:23S rRNA (cytosine1962-C5)-methyltransferase
MAVLVSKPPCVIYEDDHLLVVNKPAGWNTHAPSPYHGEGIHEWLKHRRKEWGELAIIHRLDKQTSGVLLFAKTGLANRSLTEQFATRKTRKTYQLISLERMVKSPMVVRSKLGRIGDKYASGAEGDFAETHFRETGRVRLANGQEGWLIEAKPVTGRTHQIRVHASENGFPILGDVTYGGADYPRVCLHAVELEIRHPQSRQPLCFMAEAQFEEEWFVAFRKAFIEEGTNSYRVLHGASDGFAGYYLERWGEYHLLSGEDEPGKDLLQEVRRVAGEESRGIYFKKLNKKVRTTKVEEATPRWVHGEVAPEVFTIVENGIRYEASFQQGYSVGLFLDQRDNRRRLLTGHVAARFPKLDLKGKEVLNTFAYTCGFSVCAAMAGARATSLDLSRKYLDWGRKNFLANGIDPEQHDFIYGDVFEWAQRLAKQHRQFEVILLDPPTFSQAKSSGIFQAEKHFGRLVAAVLPLLKKEGVLFASTNAQKYRPEQFLEDIKGAVGGAKRKVSALQYVPQPPDFPISREEPGYLKTAWLQVS